MENNWLKKAKRLHAIAETGLAFCDDPYDKERYEEIASLSQQMLAELASSKVETIQGLLTPEIKRYVTPQIEVRAAIFENDKILLVQEKEDSLWTLPGGYADVGLSASQNVEKEVWEEAGISVKTDTLFALRHKASGNYDADIREFYKLFFICSRTNFSEKLKSGLETSGVGFFTLDNLPPLSTGRIIKRDLHNAFTAMDSDKPVIFLD